MIAYKNMKRNKKKYRITVVSLFISIVLFLSFSTYMELIFKSVGNVVNTPEYDATLNLYMTDLNDEEIEKLRESKGVTQSFYGVEYSLVASGELSQAFTEEYSSRALREGDKFSVNLLEVSKKDANITKDIPLIYNNFNKIEYE